MSKRPRLTGKQIIKILHTAGFEELRVNCELTHKDFIVLMKKT